MPGVIPGAQHTSARNDRFLLICPMPIRASPRYATPAAAFRRRCLRGCLPNIDIRNGQTEFIRTPSFPTGGTPCPPGTIPPHLVEAS